MMSIVIIVILLDRPQLLVRRLSTQETIYQRTKLHSSRISQNCSCSKWATVTSIWTKKKKIFCLIAVSQKAISNCSKMIISSRSSKSCKVKLFRNRRSHPKPKSLEPVRQDLQKQMRQNPALPLPVLWKHLKCQILTQV